MSVRTKHFIEAPTSMEGFRQKQAAQDVRFYDIGVKRFHHPVISDPALSFKMVHLSAYAVLRRAVFTAEPGKPSHTLNLLVS
jgi:hypothetical protein